ncbi:MAG: YfhO family protein [Eubacterium sp.]|nr:YfhO family protein [Eubacterium sp.]
MKERLKKLWGRNWIALVSAGIVLVFFLTVMIVGGVAPFGDYSFTFVDSMHQYLPFFSDYQGKLQNGGSLLYTWNIGLGQNFQSLLLYYMGCPLNFLVGLGTRKGIIGFMSMMITLKLAFSAGSMGYYLSRHSGKVRNKPLMLPFALAYAIGNYMLGYMWNLMWLDCIMVMPLIILGMERIIRGESARLYTVALFYALFVNYYISFIMCIFLVLWYLTTRHETVKGFFINGFRFAGCSILAAGMAAFSLITAYLAIMKTSSASQTFPEWEWYGNIFDILKQHLVFIAPIKSQNFDGGANLYCGLFTVVFAFLYMFSNRIRIGDKIRRGILAALLIVSMNATTLNYVWHGFHDQYGIPNRFAFVYIFTMLVMGYEAAARLKNLNSGFILAAGLAMVAFIVAVIIKCDLNARVSDVKLGIICIIFVFVYSVVAILKAEDTLKPRVATIFIVSTCILELVTNALYGFFEIGFADGGFYLKYCEEMQELAEEVDRYNELSGGTFYRSEIVNPRMLDETTFDNLKGVSTFCSTVRGETVRVMDNMGFYTGVNEYLYNGATPYTNAILGIRYVYDHEDAYYPDYGYSNFLAEEGLTKVYENRYYLPIAFAMDDDILAWSMEGESDADKLNSFARLSTGADNIFERVNVDMEVSGTDCEAKVSSNNSRYISYSAKDAERIYINTEFTIPDDGIYFVEISGNHMDNVVYTLNENERADGRYTTQLFPLGKILSGDEVKLKIRFAPGYSKEGQIGIKLEKMNEDNLIYAINQHSRETLNVTDYSDNLIKGDITVSEERLMFTSIPYDEGWTVLVDGEKVEPEKVGKAFLAVPLKAGTHKVEMKFFPQGLKEGIMVSLGSLLLFVLVFFLMPFISQKRKGEKEVS